MTNEEIILRQRLVLMKAGLIKATGRTFQIDNGEGDMVTYEEPVQIHTFNHWKEAGYRVRKGEHAVASFHIWKPAKKHDDDVTDAVLTGAGKAPKMRMFLKRAFFFSEDQVEKAC